MQNKPNQTQSCIADVSIVASAKMEALAEADSNPISACPSAQNARNRQAKKADNKQYKELVVVSARSPVAEKLTGKKLIILSLDSILSPV